MNTNPRVCTGGSCVQHVSSGAHTGLQIVTEHGHLHSSDYLRKEGEMVPAKDKHWIKPDEWADELECARSHSIKERHIHAELDSRAGVLLCSSGRWPYGGRRSHWLPQGCKVCWVSVSHLLTSVSTCGSRRATERKSQLRTDTCYAETWQTGWLLNPHFVEFLKKSFFPYNLENKYLCAPDNE